MARVEVAEGHGLLRMSVTELKQALNMRGVDYRDCLEKQDLVDKLAKDMRRDGGDTNAAEAGKSRSTDVAEAKELTLTAPERRMVELFRRCAPSVVFVQTSVAVALEGSPLSLNANEEMAAGTGSGFIWDERGHIVTNYHVIKGAIDRGGRARVTLHGGTEAYEATLAGAEPEKDLAVLKVQVPREALRPVAVGSSADLLVGQSVVAIGNPFGLDHTLTVGVVSALGREVMGVGGRLLTGLVQTDAAINPGNSGGPLLDSAGRLIGVNTAIISPAGSSAGIGFAIPVDTVRRVVNQLIRYGRMQRPTLGVQVADDQILRGLSERLQLELKGVLVMKVQEGSPAANAGMQGTRSIEKGLKLGDIITAVAGTATSQVEDLLSAVEQRQVGELVDVAVLRGVGAGEATPAKLTLRVHLAERQALQQQQQQQQQPQRRPLPPRSRL